MMDRSSKINWINNHVFTNGGEVVVCGMRVENYKGLVIDGVEAENASDELVEAVFRGIYS